MVAETVSTTPPPSTFALVYLKPLTLTMCVLGLSSSLLLVVTIFARCRRWTNLPITSTLYLHICGLNILACSNIIFLGRIWNANNETSFMFVTINTMFACARPAFLLAIYLVRLESIVHPSSRIHRRDLYQRGLKVFVRCVWFGSALTSILIEACYFDKIPGCAEKLENYAFVFMLFVMLLEFSIIPVSMVMTVYMVVLYHRYKIPTAPTSIEASPCEASPCEASRSEASRSEASPCDCESSPSETSPLLSDETGRRAALLKNISLTLLIVCSILIVDLISCTFGLLENIEEVIAILNGGYMPSINLFIYRMLGSSITNFYFAFELQAATYSFLVSWVLILVQGTMRQALWGVVKRVWESCRSGGGDEV